MRKQIKDIIGLLIIVLPACVFIFVWWLHSPMYEAVRLEQRQAAQLYLTGTYYYDFSTYNPFIRQALIDYWGFEDEEINPGEIMGQYIKSQHTSNKTEIYQPKLTIDGYLRNLFREVRIEGVN